MHNCLTCNPMRNVLCNEHFNELSAQQADHKVLAWSGFIQEFHEEIENERERAYQDAYERFKEEGP